MKKIISILVAFGLLAVSGVALAKVDRVSGGYGPWNFSNPLLITYVIGGGNYHHSYTITTMDFSTGNFSGTGTYLDAPGYYETITGNINGTHVTFTIVYTASSLNPGYTLSATGTINTDGSMSGTIDGTSDTWLTSTGSVTLEASMYKNHGQYVKSQENKKEAAQSRIGMPPQSKGHTK
jgi:hypothetical protein